MKKKNQKQLQEQIGKRLYKTQTRFLFHTHIKLKIPIASSDALFDELFAVLELVNKHYNSYSEGSFFDLINKNAGHFVDVDNATIEMLHKIRLLSEITEGEYDITITPLIRLWGFYKNDGKVLPHRDEIEETKARVDYRGLEIESNRVRIGKGQEIVTGSFVKAYAVDRLVEKMEQFHIDDAIINAGGSTIRAVNKDIHHPFWHVNIENSQKKGENLFTVQLANACFSTSVQTNIFVDIDGRRYGHILSPKTGFPSENRQVGILTDNCFLGDIVSTGLFNETDEGFLRKIELLSRHFSVSGFMVDKDDRIIFTHGFKEKMML